MAGGVEKRKVGLLSIEYTKKMCYNTFRQNEAMFYHEQIPKEWQLFGDFFVVLR